MHSGAVSPPFRKIMDDVFQELDVLQFAPIYEYDRSLILNRMKVFNLHIALVHPFFDISKT